MKELLDEFFLEVLEAKEQERDHKIHIILVQNKALGKRNKILKELKTWL